MFRHAFVSFVGAVAVAAAWSATTQATLARDDQSQDDQKATAQQNDSRSDQNSDRQQARQRNRDDDETQYRGTEHAALGIMLSERDGQGVRVRDILPDSPAEEAGLREGDRITKIDDRQMNTYRDVVRYINHVNPGDKATVVVSRDGQDKSFTVTFAQRDRVYSDDRQFTRSESRERRNNYDSQRNQDDGDRQRHAVLGVDLSGDRDELTIQDVWSASPADKAGMHRGDEILAIDDHQVGSREAFREQLRSHEPGDHIKITIRRDGKEQTLKTHLVSAQELAQQIHEQRNSQATKNSGRNEARQANARGRTGYQRWSINEHHPALGVTLAEDNDGRLTVGRVIDDGPADTAGIKQGDEILAIDDQDVDSVRDVMRQLSHKKFNDKVTVRVRHEGRKRDIAVTLGDSADVFNDQRTANRADQRDGRDGSSAGNRDSNRDDDRDQDRD